MRPMGSNQSGFAAQQAAQRYHHQGVARVGLGGLAIHSTLTAAQVERLVAPLDDPARSALLEVGQELAPLVDENAPLEQQLDAIRTHFDERIDKLEATIAGVQDVAAEILRELPNALVQDSDQQSARPEAEQADNVVAAVIIVVYTLAAGVGLAEPALRDSIALVIAWLAAVYPASKKL